ncbi:MAG: glycosyltransferase family 4 protein [Terriglobales bacterium]
MSTASPASLPELGRTKETGRVLHVYASPLFGGIETLLLALARERYRTPELQPEFALCFSGRLVDELAATGAGVHGLGPLRLRHPWSLWRARRRLAALLRGTAWDAVICHAGYTHALFAPIVRQQGVPLGFWMHDAGDGKHWIDRWARRSPPDFCIANSTYTARFAASWFPGVIPNVLRGPVPPSRIQDAVATREHVRRALGAQPATPVILMAARLEPWKGHFLLLEALSRLHDVPGWSCWVAGGPQRPHEARYAKRLAARVRSLGLGDRVRFLGQRADVFDLMAASDVFCQPNLKPEPLGLSILEALAHGLPVVAVAAGGVLDSVDATCGRLVAPTAEAVAGALRELLTQVDLRRRLAAAGPGRAAQVAGPAQLLDLARWIETAVHATGGGTA